MPPLLVGEALAYRRVFVGQRFAPVCPAAGIGFGADRRALRKINLLPRAPLLEELPSVSDG